MPPKPEETKEQTHSKKEGKDKGEKQEKEGSGGKEKEAEKKEESKLTSPVPGVLLRSLLLCLPVQMQQSHAQLYVHTCILNTS